MDKEAQNKKKKEFYAIGFLDKACKLLYFELFNVLYRIESSGYHYCFCEKYDGCCRGPSTYQKICCVICQINYHDDVEDLEPIKYKPKELFEYASRLYDDLNEATKIDGRQDWPVSECWSGEHEFKWRDWSSGEMGGILLSQTKRIEDYSIFILEHELLRKGNLFNGR